LVLRFRHAKQSSVAPVAGALLLLFLGTAVAAVAAAAALLLLVLSVVVLAVFSTLTSMGWVATGEDAAMVKGSWSGGGEE
jgi:putative effector of murein hydrolase LrgA (UPF0299 family)